MYLSKLYLNNFRSFIEEEVYFEPSLTVIVGENNGGKSNLIDAIRLLSTPLNDRRELYCERTDIRFGTNSPLFTIQATFDKLTPPQQGRLISATTDDTLVRASFGLTYDASGSQLHIRPKLWAGRFKTPPELGAHETIRHVYLPPLRDAKRALASGNPTRIHALLHHFLNGRDPNEIAMRLARTNEEQILKDVDLAVSSRLEDLTTGVRRQSASLGFNTDERLIEIARDLRFKLADHGIAPEDLQYSGHGYANLLYIATIAVELEKTDNADLTMFLVEEPEAHLHPQLQAAVLNFLEERAEQSLKPKEDKNAPAGNLQVIVATHSPNLSAWVPIKNLVFVRIHLQLGDANDEADKTGDGQSDIVETACVEKAPRSDSRCVPLSKLGLEPDELRKIDRYLDVTKSALLFGGRVILVEGIAEALLLPVIAKKYVLNNDPIGWRKFRSAAFIPIDGVDFTPYAKVVLTRYNGVCIAERVVIITDGDKHTVEDGKSLPGNNRKTQLEKIAEEQGAQELLDVVVNTYSLETELVIAGNAECLKKVFLKLHSRSTDKWDCAVALSGDERAKAIQGLFESTPKGDFAQLLAEQIMDSESFQVPLYIRQAIEVLVK